MQLVNVRSIASVLAGLVAAVLVIGGIIGVAAMRESGSRATSGQLSPLAPECAKAGLDLATSYGRIAVLTGSFRSTAGQVAAWQEKSRGPNAPHIASSPWRTRSADEPVAVCYYDGTFDGLALPGGPPGTGATPAPALTVDRIVVLVDGRGAPELYAAGPSASLPIEDPLKP